MGGLGTWRLRFGASAAGAAGGEQDVVSGKVDEMVRLRAIRGRRRELRKLLPSGEVVSEGEGLPAVKGSPPRTKDYLDP